MKEFIVTVTFTGTEKFVVKADSAQAAEAMWQTEGRLTSAARSDDAVRSVELI